MLLWYLREQEDEHRPARAFGLYRSHAVPAVGTRLRLLDSDDTVEVVRVTLPVVRVEADYDVVCPKDRERARCGELLVVACG